MLGRSGSLILLFALLLPCAGCRSIYDFGNGLNDLMAVLDDDASESPCLNGKQRTHPEHAAFIDESEAASPNGAQRRPQAGDAYFNEQKQVVTLLNALRVEEGVGALRFDPASRLQQAARNRAREIAVSFSHTRPDGRDCSTVLDDYGLSYSQSGENIAYGTNLGAKKVFQMWSRSSGHYGNMISPEYKEVGVASFHGSGRNVYWVQIFLTR